jgi:hypothetical protein
MRIFVVVLLFSLVSTPLRAQDSSAGASYTLLSLTYPDQMPSGFGGWLTWKFIDVAANVFPEDHPIIGRQTQLVAGVRGGVRMERLGVFARVRPGFVHFSERFFAPDIVCVAIFPPPEACLIEPTNLAVDMGGTVELFATSRATLRVDLGDTLIRFARDGQDPVWKHNFQLAVGAGLRF